LRILNKMKKINLSSLKKHQQLKIVIRYRLMKQL
jgi:hypothetical protein